MPQESEKPANSILSEEQEKLLDAYVQKLDAMYEQLKLAEAVQVTIETEHLKRILSR